MNTVPNTEARPYIPRHAAPINGRDESKWRRYVTDLVAAADAVSVLAAQSGGSEDTRRLYATLHRLGALHPQPADSIPAADIIARHDAAVAA